MWAWSGLQTLVPHPLTLGCPPCPPLAHQVQALPLPRRLPICPRHSVRALLGMVGLLGSPLKRASLLRPEMFLLQPRLPGAQHGAWPKWVSVNTE